MTGGAGHGVRVADVERGWTVDHIDLQAHHIAAHPLNGTINNASRGHGTSVLGIIAATPVGAPPTGIASEVDAILPSSHYQSTLRAAILAVIRSPSMRFGDLLLVEAQVDAYPPAKRYGPVELIEVNYEILRLATALGIIVVETGGTAPTTAPRQPSTWTTGRTLPVTGFSGATRRTGSSGTPERSS